MKCMREIMFNTKNNETMKQFIIKFEYSFAKRKKHREMITQN